MGGTISGVKRSRSQYEDDSGETPCGSKSDSGVIDVPKRFELLQSQVLSHSFLLDPCDIQRHVGRRDNAIYLLWEMKSIVIQKYFIVLSSNMALCRRGYCKQQQNKFIQTHKLAKITKMNELKKKYRSNSYLE